MQPVTALSIAGSDSGGGAGIQADIRSFNAFRASRHDRPHGGDGPEHARRVRRRDAVSPTSSRHRYESVADDFDVKAVKTGMLAQAATVERVAESRARRSPSSPRGRPGTGLNERRRPYGRRRSRGVSPALFPLAEVITPNLREAADALWRRRSRRGEHRRRGTAGATSCSLWDRATYW